MVNNCEETPPKIQMCDELFVFFFFWNMHLQKLHLIVSIFHIQEDEKKVKHKKLDIGDNGVKGVALPCRYMHQFKSNSLIFYL